MPVRKPLNLSMKHFQGNNSEEEKGISFPLLLRPQTLKEYIGQSKVVRTLQLAIEAAKKRGEPLEHCILYGPPGLGKTTLANVISREMNTNIIITSGPAIEKVGDIAAILTNLKEGDIIFIDEIHRLNSAVEEMLYSALEEFRLDVVIGQGPGARTVKIDLAPFTLIGATTRMGLLTSPLRDRFGLVLRLDFYSVEELETIIKRSAQILGIGITDEASVFIARSSRGTPRIANKLLRRVRDMALVSDSNTIDIDMAKKVFELLEINEFGLDYLDRKYLSTIKDKFKGGPVGIETLSASLGEDRRTIEDVVEPYLLQMGYIKRTPKGRTITPKALEHLYSTGLKPLF